jgi:hypothetical protein
MLKKRENVSHAPGTRRLICSRLDIRCEALPNDRGYSRHSFGKGSCHAGIGRRQELAADQDASGLFCAEVFSSVGEHADRGISSLSKRR